jgi:hypothetical protein
MAIPSATDRVAALLTIGRVDEAYSDFVAHEHDITEGSGAAGLSLVDFDEGRRLRVVREYIFRSGRPIDPGALERVVRLIRPDDVQSDPDFGARVRTLLRAERSINTVDLFRSAWKSHRPNLQLELFTAMIDSVDDAGRKCLLEDISRLLPCAATVSTFAGAYELLSLSERKVHAGLGREWVLNSIRAAYSWMRNSKEVARIVRDLPADTCEEFLPELESEIRALVDPVEQVEFLADLAAAIESNAAQEKLLIEADTIAYAIGPGPDQRGPTVCSALASEKRETIRAKTRSLRP